MVRDAIINGTRREVQSSLMNLCKSATAARACINVFGSGIYGFPRWIITIIIPRFCCVLSFELMASIKTTTRAIEYLSERKREDEGEYKIERDTENEKQRR